MSVLGIWSYLFVHRKKLYYFSSNKKNLYESVNVINNLKGGGKKKPKQNAVYKLP